MTRQNYGTLRGRRNGSGAWQWVVIGFVLGFGCAAIAGLLVVIGGASGLVDLQSVFAANRPTQTPIVITNTPAPVTPTPEPTEALLPSATVTVAQVAVLAPSATPTTNPIAIQVEPSATATTQVVPTQTSSVGGASTSGGTEVNVPAQLVNILTAMRDITGGQFEMGTTPQEVAAAVQECTDVYSGTCTPAMGEDSFPPHTVTLNAFRMEEKEVTYTQYIAFLNSLGQNGHRTGCGGQICIATRAEDQNSNIIFDSANYRVNDAILEYPVAGVTWYGADTYCKAIGRRLPTEAEWEHAARGDSNALYPWGNNTFSSDFARTKFPEEEDATLRGARAVAQYPAGAYSLYDMAGNVAEWVYDWYSPTYYNQLAQGAQPIPPNPQGPPAGTRKVVRGGSWADQPFFTRAVQRVDKDPTVSDLSIGFRCVADVTAASTNNLSVPGSNTVPPTTEGSSGTSEGDSSNSVPTLPPPPINNSAPPTSTPILPTLDSGSG